MGSSLDSIGSHGQRHSDGEIRPIRPSLKVHLVAGRKHDTGHDDFSAHFTQHERDIYRAVCASSYSVRACRFLTAWNVTMLRLGKSNFDIRVITEHMATPINVI